MRANIKTKKIEYENCAFDAWMFICVVRCAIWYHLCNLKNLKNTHEGVLILVKLQAPACNFTKINTLSWVFFAFFKSYKWYQIVQRSTCMPYVYPFCISENSQETIHDAATFLKLVLFMDNYF